jgi:hypothetical protein
MTPFEDARSEDLQLHSFREEALSVLHNCSLFFYTAGQNRHGRFSAGEHNVNESYIAGKAADAPEIAWMSIFIVNRESWNN